MSRCCVVLCLNSDPLRYIYPYHLIVLIFLLRFSIVFYSIIYISYFVLLFLCCDLRWLPSYGRCLALSCSLLSTCASSSYLSRSYRPRHSNILAISSRTEPTDSTSRQVRSFSVLHVLSSIQGPSNSLLVRCFYLFSQFLVKPLSVFSCIFSSLYLVSLVLVSASK